MQRWHAGLRVTGQRKLEVEEIAELRELRRSSWKRFAIAIARLLILLITPLAIRLLPVSTTIQDLAFLATPGILVAVAMVGLPAAISKTLLLPRLLGRDIRNGAIDLCEGTREELITGAKELPDWSSNSHRSEGERCLIEVLPTSHLLWSIDGERLSDLRLLQSSVTAHAPLHAELAAQFVRQVEPEAPFLVHSRALSGDELRELESYAPRPQATDLALPVTLWLTAISAIAVAIAQQWSTLLLPFLLALAALALTPRAVRSVQTRRWIAPDVTEGRVIIIRWRSEDEEGNEKLSPPVEFLPHSKVVWSERSGPAPWRRIVNGRPLAE
jgi:hypothetical protein